MDNIERQAIQKNLDERAPRESIDDATNERNINWHMTNYPPILNAFHWNLSELTKQGAMICSSQRILFFLATIVGFWNFIQTIVIFAAQPPKNATAPQTYYAPENILGGALLMLCMGVYGMFLHILVFYVCGRMTKWFFQVGFIAMGIYAFACLCWGVFGSFANFEGFANFLRASNSPWLSEFWIASTVMEGTSWIILFLGQCSLMFILRDYKNGYAAKIQRQRAINKERHKEQNKSIATRINESVDDTTGVATKVKNKIFGGGTKTVTRV